MTYQFLDTGDAVHWQDQVTGRHHVGRVLKRDVFVLEPGEQRMSCRQTLVKCCDGVYLVDATETKPYRRCETCNGEGMVTILTSHHTMSTTGVKAPVTTRVPPTRCPDCNGE